MATETVPAQASGGKVVEAWWFGLLVRSALALLGLWTLSFAADRYDSFLVDYQRQLRMNNWLWLSWASAMVAAGFLFGLGDMAAIRQGSLPAEPPPAGRSRAAAPRSLLVGLHPGSRVGGVAGAGLLVRRGADPVRVACSCRSRDRVRLQGQNHPSRVDLQVTFPNTGAPQCPVHGWVYRVPRRHGSTIWDPLPRP